MSDPKFADTHNLVAFLEKPIESEGFEEIVDFLNANPIKYALTINPTIYCSCVKQFWDTIKAKTVTGEVQLQALVDKKKVIITESTIRRDLQLEDANGVDCLPNVAISKQLTLIGIPTHSNDPLLSGEERLKLNELMELCTNLSQRVLDLKKTKTSQAAKIASLKKRFKKLERKRKSKPPKMKRLFKISRSAQVVIPSKDKDMTEKEVDMAEKDVSTVDPVTTTGEVVTTANVVVSTAEVTTNSTTTTTVDELTLAQTLIEIKAAKPKAVTTTATTTTTVVIRPKARGVVV
ncbi:hypothetical protein Tco_0979251 [Tanacetum coccineum]